MTIEPHISRRRVAMAIVISALSFATPAPAAPPGTAAEPIRYTGAEFVDPDMHDGGLRPAVGVKTNQVFRATRTNAAEGNGVNWTYNHAPDLAYWSGRYFLEYTAGPINEPDLPPNGTTNRFLTTSTDGRTWAMSMPSFPTLGTGTGNVNVGAITGVSGITSSTRGLWASRSAFYAANNGRLLLSTSLGTSSNKAVGRVIREVYNTTPVTLGPTYFIRYYAHSGFNASNTAVLGIPFYTVSTDTDFKTACTELLGRPLVTENWYEDEVNSQNTDATTVPTDGFYKINYTATADGVLKAMIPFQRKDGNWVGVWKWTFGGLSSDGGQTWSLPLKMGTITNAGAKVWGEATKDGRYAFVLNPKATNLKRWPLAVLTSDDGIGFDNYAVVHGEISTQRYAGVSKEAGPQYVRGIAPWNPSAPGNDMRVAYSVNKEDMWMASVPVPIVRSVSSHVNDSFNSGDVSLWNLQNAVWAPVTVQDFPSASDKSLRLEDRDPFDYATAIRVFPESSNVTVSFRARPSQANTGSLQAEVVSGNGRRATRVIFAADGQIKAFNGTTSTNLQAYTANTWYTIQIQADATTGKFNVLVNGTLRLNQGNFSESASSLERLVLRTGDYRNTPTQASPAYVTVDVANPGTAVTNAVFAVDDVTTADTVAPAITSAITSAGRTIRLTFSEAVGATTASLASNYSLSSGLSITSATLLSDGRTVALSTSGTLAAGTAYTVTVNGVADISGNVIAANSQRGFTVGAQAAVPTTGLRMWVRADTGITKDASDFVSNWADQSGLGNSLANGGATTARPKLIANALNGRPVVRFDGGDWLERATSGLVADKMTVFTIFKANRPAAAQFVFDTATDGATSRHSFVQDTEGLKLVVDASDKVEAYEFENNQFIAYTGAMDAMNSTTWVNGGNARREGMWAQSPAPTSSASPFVLGARYTKNQAYYNGDVAELLIYNRPLSEAERRAVEEYLIGKYLPGLTETVAPTLSVPGGSYAGTQSVTVTAPTAGSSLRYTLDGSTPTQTNGTAITSGAAVSVSSSATLRVLAYKAGLADSPITSATYVIGGGGGGTVSAPTFSPAAGTYSSTQNVTISTTTSGATIRYTTNGTDPTPATGTVYSGPVAIGATTTLKAIAYASGMTNSAVATAAYTINTGGGSGTAFSDSFGRSNVNTGTTQGSTVLGSGWTMNSDVQTPERGGAQIVNGELQIGQPSAGGYAGVGGADRTWVWQDTQNWSGYTATLASNSGVVTWTFNMRTGQSNPTPAGTSGGGTAVVFLANAEPGTGNWNNGLGSIGYLVTYNDSSVTDPLKLVRTTKGANETGHTTVINASTAPFNDLSNQYLSVRVTYNPATNGWTLAARNDGTGFQDPAAGTLTALGTATDATHTGTVLRYMGFLGNSNNGINGAADDVRFDNLAVTVEGLAPAQPPYGGAAWALPGTVQAEDYDTGGQDVAFNDTTSGNSGNAYRMTAGDNVDIEATTDTGGGHNVGWIAAGEWMEYTVNVASAGTYTLEARVASSGGGGAIRFEFDGVDKTGTMTVPNTGGWQTYQTISKTGLSLAAGTQVIRCHIVNAGVNLNWFRLLQTGAGAVAPDYGGYDTLEEFAFGHVPAAGGTRPLVRVLAGATDFSATYIKNKAAARLTYIPEWSTDMKTWSAEGVTEDPSADLGDAVEMTVRVPRDGRPSIFMRVRVEE